jgi:hypothetical protein
MSTLRRRPLGPGGRRAQDLVLFQVEMSLGDFVGLGADRLVGRDDGRESSVVSRILLPMTFPLGTGRDLFTTPKKARPSYSGPIHDPNPINPFSSPARSSTSRSLFVPQPPSSHAKPTFVRGVMVSSSSWPAALSFILRSEFASSSSLSLRGELAWRQTPRRGLYHACEGQGPAEEARRGKDGQRAASIGHWRQ